MGAMRRGEERGVGAGECCGEQKGGEVEEAEERGRAVREC